MDSRPVMYDNGSSSHLELCLLEYSTEINDGSCVDWVCSGPLASQCTDTDAGLGKRRIVGKRDGREEDCAKVNLKLFIMVRISHIKKTSLMSWLSHQLMNRVFQTLFHHFISLAKSKMVGWNLSVKQTGYFTLASFVFCTPSDLSLIAGKSASYLCKE